MLIYSWHNLMVDTLFQMKPSQFLFQMLMNTEQKLANMHTMNIPQKVELLDMAETTHQKVHVVKRVKLIHNLHVCMLVLHSYQIDSGAGLSSHAWFLLWQL